MDRTIEGAHLLRKMAWEDGKGDLAVLLDCWILAEKKARDYQGGGVSRDAYFPFGVKSYVQMIVVKANRLVSLLRQTGEPNFEGVADSAKDVINYAAFLIERLERDNVSPKT
jgi:hypothetical protein